MDQAMDRQKLLKETYQLLDEEKKSSLVPRLRNVIKEHNKLYYNDQAPIISDHEWDRLFDMLKTIEEENPSLITKDSPTQTITLDIQDEFIKAKHYNPMLSLANTYNEKDLREFDKRIQKTLIDPEYIIELKFDGIGISLVYENDTLTRAATRGDGQIGEDITANAKTLTSIPKKALFSKYGLQKIEVRGEIIMPHKAFIKVNQEKEKPFISPRNAASGSLRQLDPNVTATRGLEGYFYSIKVIEGKTPLTYQEEAILLKNLGFKTSPFFEVCNNIDKVIEYTQKMEKKKKSYTFDVDGLVIKVNETKYQELLGTTSHHPRWAIAYKFPADTVQTVIESVDFQIGRTGAITPVANLQEVKLSGANIRRATLHNFEDMRTKDIRIFDTVEIKRAGEVIPAVVRSITAKRNGKETRITPPKTCPVCQSKVQTNTELVAIICSNPKCPAIIKAQLKHFVSRDAMNIEGLGARVIDELVDTKILFGFEDIYTLNTFDTTVALEKMDGFGKKSLQNLFTSIEASKTRPLRSIIFALGIHFIGKRSAKILEEEIHTMFDLHNMPVESLEEIRDIGPKVAKSVYDYFQNQENIKMLKTLKKHGLHFEKTSSSIQQSKKFTGKTFVITGSFEGFTRNDIASSIEEAGGQVVGSISKNTDYLVVGDKAGSKLQKAKDLKIHIMNEEDCTKIFSLQKKEIQQQVGLF